MIIINPIGKNSRRFCALPPRCFVVELNCESFPQLKNIRDHISSEVPSGDQMERVAANSLASERKIYWILFSTLLCAFAMYVRGTVISSGLSNTARIDAWKNSIACLCVEFGVNKECGFPLHMLCIGPNHAVIPRMQWAARSHMDAMLCLSRNDICSLCL